MKVTIHEHFRLRPGMRIMLSMGPAVVERVTACAAVCRLEKPVVRQFQTIGGLTVRIEAKGEIIRISPNAEVEIL